MYREIAIITDPIIEAFLNECSVCFALSEVPHPKFIEAMLMLHTRTELVGDSCKMLFPWARNADVGRQRDEILAKIQRIINSSNLSARRFIDPRQFAMFRSYTMAKSLSNSEKRPAECW